MSTEPRLDSIHFRRGKRIGITHLMLLLTNEQVASHAKLTKRASAHSFRHSFSSRLLQASYGIRSIQEFLRHSDLRTTMIYTHTVQSKMIKQAQCPLDF
jgi:site-specific recombinase XerD